MDKYDHTVTSSMGDRIRESRKAAGISQKGLGDIMGVTRNTVINWENGKYRPDADLFPKLCDTLNITLYDLFGIVPENNDDISVHERKVLSDYRRISTLGRRIVDNMISSILNEEILERERVNEEKNRLLNESVRMVDFISTAAAAGDGYDFSDVPVEEYRFVFINDHNKDADGIIRVKGSSMLPVYSEGDYVYVKYIETANPGEDVLCSSSAGIHIKRLGDNGVYSLNKAFPFNLTSPDDHVQIIGKVLGTVSSSDYPTMEENNILQELRHDEIREFMRSKGR